LAVEIARDFNRIKQEAQKGMQRSRYGRTILSKCSLDTDLPGFTQIVLEGWKWLHFQPCPIFI